ncbi:MAG: hypothetical protein AAGE96_14445 [Cyanobacteria bacterium P01_G01_bin.19]
MDLRISCHFYYSEVRKEVNLSRVENKMNHYEVEGYVLVLNHMNNGNDDLLIGFIPLWDKSIQEQPIPQNPNRPIFFHECYASGHMWDSENLSPPGSHSSSLSLYRKHLIDCALINHAIAKGYGAIDRNPNIELTWRSSKDLCNSKYIFDDNATRYPIKLFNIGGNLIPGKHYAIKSKLIVDVEFIEPPLYKSDGRNYISLKKPNKSYHFNE